MKQKNTVFLSKKDRVECVLTVLKVSYQSETKTKMLSEGVDKM